MEIDQSFNDDDFSEANEAIYNSTKTKEIDYILVDARKLIPGRQLSQETAAIDYFRSITSASQNIRVAFVSYDIEVGLGIEKFIADSMEMGNHWQMKSFIDIDEAKNWMLGTYKDIDS